MDELNHIHFDIVNDYVKNSKEGKISHYMITVSRDGESPVRSIISFDNIAQALEGYEMYQDAGFAKDYLTVSMYEPSGKINTKVLKRNHAGDPSFVRQNYLDTVEALHKVKDKLDKEDYEDLCIKIVTSFAKDNWRFSADRFLKQLEIEREL
jgi:uncharacterized protein (UPF0248 family)